MIYPRKNEIDKKVTFLNFTNQNFLIKIIIVVAPPEFKPVVAESDSERRKAQLVG